MTREVTIRISYNNKEGDPLTYVTMSTCAYAPVEVGDVTVQPGDVLYLTRAYINEDERLHTLADMYSELGAKLASQEKEYPDA